MEPELLSVLREAVKIRQRKEELDRAIGRALRRRQMNFDVYVKIMSELRELAKDEKISVDDAATKLLGEKE